MQNGLLFILLITLSISCNKEDERRFINKFSDKIIRYEITIENNQISEYSYYVNDILTSKNVFQDFDSIAYLIRTYASNEVFNKKIYFIDDNNLASSAIDSVFGDNVLYVSTLNYEYQNGFLINTSIERKQIGQNADSTQVNISKMIENENIVKITRSYPDWPSGCSDYLEYNNMSNIIDIRYFTNGITGEISKNLVQHAIWNRGCPCGPASSSAYSEFKYELDNNGYVIKKTEKYTPCYHLTTVEDVTRTIRNTIYEYNFL